MSSKKIYTIDNSLCILCGFCLTACKYSAIIKEEKSMRIIPEKCTGCGICKGSCLGLAIKELERK